MTINVLAFGIAKEILGGSSVAITITGTNTVNNLKQQIENQYIGIKKLTSFMIAVKWGICLIRTYPKTRR